MFSDEKLSQTGQKTTKYWYNVFFIQAHLTVLNIKKQHR